MKAFVSRSLIGIFFGSFIALLLVNINVNFSESNIIDKGLLLQNSIASVLLGWFFTVSPLYFEMKSLKLSQQTILHFLTVISLYFILAIAVGWIPFTITSFMLSLLIFIAIYIIIWIAFYLYFKNQVQKMNDDLNKI